VSVADNVEEVVRSL